MRLTLRTLLAYLDDTLPPDQAKLIGQKIAESEAAQELIDRIRKVTRKRSLSTPTVTEPGSPSDPNTVAEYLSDTLPSDTVAVFEKACLDADVHLAEAAACHQILTLLLSEPVRVPPTARQRMYVLVKGKESLPHRKPGVTAPAAGELPDAPPADADGDADAAFLLGMRAYSRSEPFERRATTLVAVGGLVILLASVVWLAVPANPQRSREVAVAPLVVPVPLPVNKPNDPVLADPGVKPVVPDKDNDAEKPNPTRSGDNQAAKPPEKPADPVKPGDLVPAPDKPRMDRLPLGRVENADAVVVVSRNGGRWVRATGKEPGVMSADRTVCLPGYKAKIRIEPGTEVELWGNTPELQPFPVLETAVTFHPPAEGYDADLTVHAGRVYFSAKRPGGSRVRMRFRDENWDLTLSDEKSEAVVEVVNSLVRGMGKDTDPAELPVTNVAVAVLRGAAGLKARYKDHSLIKSGEGVSWSSKGAGVQSLKVGRGPMGRDSAYFNRFELPSGEAAKAAQRALADLAKTAERDGVEVAFAERLRDDQIVDSQKKATAAQIAVLGLAALGELPPVIDALNDSNRPFARAAAAYALPATLAGSSDGVERFRKQLTDKLGLSPEQTAEAVRLVRGCTDAERRNAEGLDRLIDALNSNVLVIRELGYHGLQSLTDAATPPPPVAMRYDAAAPGDVRDPAVKAWKRYTEDLKKKGQ